MRLSGSRVQGSGFRKNRAAGQRSYTTTSNPTTTTGRRPDATARIPTATTGPRPDATARIPMDTTERRPDATARIPTVGALPRSAIPRPKGIRTANSSGVALILTLGLLAVITLAVVAFVVTMRIEHLAARNTSSRTAARQYVEVGLAEAMGAVNGTLIYSAYPVQGWSVTNTPECLYAPATNAQGIYLFRGAVTNLLPGLLAQQAAQAYCDWNITITETNTATGNAGIQAGRVSFLIVNLSGMMDVHALDTNKLAALGEGLTAYNRMNPTGAYQRVFLTQPDLTAANNGAVSNLVTFSYDPGPEVFFAYTNLPSIGTYAFGGMLSNRFNINSATQYVGNYDSAAFQANWLTPVSNLLADAGLPASDQVAWNILNYLDPGRTPVVAAGSPPAYRTGYGVKDIPMINRVSLEPINANPEYGVSVELWYPFVPNPAPDKVWLWVGVYTNDSFLADAQTAIANLGDPPLSPMSFKVLVPTQMNYGGAAEFYVGATTNLPAPPLPISFKELVPFPLPPTTVYHVIGKDYPVWIWPRVYVEDAPGHLVCVDEALVCGNLPTRWEGAGCIQYGDPRTNQCGAAMVDATSGLTLVATNANCSIPSLPLVHADAPMRSAGELRHIYAPGLPGGRIDFTTRLGGAVRDRFSTRTTNAPVHGRVNANTPYTNIWQALLSDVTIGWTNQIHPGDCSGSIGARLDQASQVALASTVANALLNTDGRGWVCNEEMYPLVGSNLLSSVMATNSVGDMDARAVCGDILAGISDRVSFRGNSFLVIVCGQRLSPLGRVLADQRAAYTIVRDAFTGRWVVDNMVWLTE